MSDLLNIRLNEIHGRLASHKIKIDVSAEAKEWLCDAGYSPAYGARPLNRIVKTHVLDPLSRAMLSGAVCDEETVVVDLKGDKIVVVPNHVVDGEGDVLAGEDEEEL